MDTKRAAISVFISYARYDSVIADRLVADLEARGVDVVIDRRDLPYGEEWQAELSNFIASADTVVWLVSPNSLVSRWCNWELGEVQRTSKRLVPLRIAPVSPADLPEALGRIHLLPAEGVYDPSAHLDTLVGVLNTDHAWIKDHTRLAGDAAAWLAAGRSRDLLLRGRALSEAEGWRDCRPPAAPPVSPETLDLLLESRRGATGRLRQLSGIAIGVAVALAVLAIVAVLQRNDAQEQRSIAEGERGRAEAALVEAETARTRAEQQRAVAEQQRARAEQETARAEIAAETAMLQREIAVARAEAADNPIAALERSVRAARRNEADAAKGTVPMLDEVHAGLFVTLDAGRDMPNFWAAGTRSFPAMRTILEQPSPTATPRRLIVTREQALLVDHSGKVLAPPIGGPDFAPGNFNAGLWARDGAGTRFALASGEFVGTTVSNVGVGLYSEDAVELGRFFTSNPYPYIALMHLWGRQKLVAVDSYGSLFVIDTKTLTGSKVLEGAGLAIRGMQFADYSNPPRLLLAYGPAPAYTSIPRAADVPPPRAADPAAVQSALGKALGTPNLVVQVEGTAEADGYLCAVELPSLGPQQGMLSCGERGVVSHWANHEGTKTAFAFGRPFNTAGDVPTATAYSPDLDAVAIGDASGAIRIWSFSGQELTPILRRTEGPVAVLAFVDGGRTLLAQGEQDTTVRQWSISDFIQSEMIVGPGTFNETAVTPDGAVRLLFDDAAMTVEDADGNQLASFPVADLDPYDTMIAIAGDGSRIAWSEPGAVVVADVATSENQTRLPLPDGKAPMILTLSQDGRTLFTSLKGTDEITLDSEVTLLAPPIQRIYDLPEQLTASRIVTEWNGDPQAPVSAAVALSRQGEPFVLGDREGRLTILGADGAAIWTSEPLRDNPSVRLSIARLAASADGKRLLAVGRPDAVSIVPPRGRIPNGFVPSARLAFIDLDSRQTVGQLIQPQRDVGAVGIDPTGALAATTSLLGEDEADPLALALYSPSSMTRLATLPIPDTGSGILHLWFTDDGAAHAATRFLDEQSWHIGVPALLATAERKVDAVRISREYDSSMRLSETAATAQDYDAVQAHLRRATELRPGSSEAWLRLGNYLYSPAQGEGDAAAAAAAYDRAIELNPYDHLPLARRGRLRYWLGDFDGAVEDFSVAVTRPVTMIPMLPVGTGGLDIGGTLRGIAGNIREGILAEAMSYRGYTLYKLGRFEEAAVALRGRIARRYGTARDFEFLGFALAKSGNPAAALVAIDMAITRLESGSYSNIEGFERQGDTEIERLDAVCDYAERAADLPGADRIAWLTRARDACAAAVAIDPTFRDTATRLARIEATLAS